MEWNDYKEIEWKLMEWNEMYLSKGKKWKSRRIENNKMIENLEDRKDLVFLHFVFG